MSVAIKPALENLDEALDRLENVIENRVVQGQQGVLNFDTAEEKEVNQEIASKLDSTIKRLETLLSEE